jgi:alanyl aminopeptidase
MIPGGLLILSVAASTAGPPQPPTLRLPSDVAPSRYALELTLDPAKDDFSGVATIALDVRRPTTVVWLNAYHLKVASATLEQGGARRAATVVAGGEHFVGLAVEEPLAVGEARLIVAYTGGVNQKAGAGIFLSRHGEDRYLFTQFEPIDARSAFPCFDEPGYKVPWRLTLLVPAAQTAVSNMPVQSEFVDRGAKRVVFRETPPLPSYLVAFAVGPLETVDGGTACRKEVPVRIVVPRGDAPRARYAAEVTAEILTRLEEYFDIPYPYAKADQVAIPRSFGGAMENPGLVTYDSELILAPPQGEDTPQRQRGYASVAAHELAHEWFGDLVTMAWWNDTWLNESLATFMEQKLVANWKPEWDTRVEDQGSRTYALWFDRLATVRRIDQPVESTTDIANAFDGITYQKGAAVLTMFERFMGEEAFRRAVRAYLEGHRHGNATADDFLDALGGAGGLSVSTSFRTFLQQAGAPLVRMSLRCEGGAVRVEMTQERFRPVGSDAAGDETWEVPVCVAWEGGGARQTQCTTVASKTGSLALPTAACPAWFLGNVGEAGYYYSGYDSQALETLVANRQKLSLAEQAGLFGELDNLARAGRLLLSDGLKLAAQLADEPNRFVVQAALQLASVRVDFLPAAFRPRYRHYVRDAFGAHARRLGWIPRKGEGDDERLLRPELVRFVAHEGEEPDLVASATALARRWLDTRETLPADTFAAIFETAARHGDASLYDRILAAAKAEKEGFFQEGLVRALGAFRQRDLVARNLSLLMDGTFDMRIATPLLFGPLDDPETARLPLETVMAHYDAIVARLPSAAGMDYAAFLPETAGSGCSTGEATEAQEFFGPRLAKVNGGPRSLAQVVERIQLCAARKDAQQADLIRFFEAPGQTSRSIPR